MEVAPPLSFRDFPWRWRDVLLGYLPFPVFLAIAYFLRHMLVDMPGWAWILLSYATGTWMCAYPVYIVRSRTGLPAWPRPRTMIVLALVAIPLLVTNFAAEAAVTYGVNALLGDPDEGVSPIDVMTSTTNPLRWVFLYILGVVVAPLGEEPFHRGMLYNALRQRMHWVPAVVLVSIVFALFHPYGLAGRAAVFVSGVCLAGFYEWKKTLFAPMTLHALINAFAMTASLFAATAVANSPMIGLVAEGRDNGCLVIHVAPGGAAETAGIRAGDIVTEIDVHSVRRQHHLFTIMQMHKAGDNVPVKYLRGGQQFTVTVTLKERPK